MCVVLPQTTREIVQLLRIAEAEGVPIVPGARGRGEWWQSAVPNCIVLCTVKMDQILEVIAPI